MRFPFAAVLAAGLAFAPVPGFAADPRPMFTRPAPTGESDTYVVTIEANGQFTPRFPGSRDLAGLVYPSLSFRRSDEPARFTAPDDGISISVLDTPSFRVGPVARFQAGRYLDDDRRLLGLRKLNFDVEPGLFAEFWPLTFIRARLEARHGLRGSSGFAGNAGVDFVLPFDRFTYSLGPRLTFGDNDYMQRYFGLTPLEASRSRFAAFRARGGITSVGLLGAVTYAFNETWATTGYVGYNRLIADAADSPIVRGIGSRDQLTFGAKLSYSFNYTR